MSAAGAPGERGCCPVCRRPTLPRYRPFCSKRCADIDLGRWFGEAYRIPATAADGDDAADADGGPDVDGDDGDADDGATGGASRGR